MWWQGRAEALAGRAGEVEGELLGAPPERLTDEVPPEGLCIRRDAERPCLHSREAALPPQIDARAKRATRAKVE